jgi:hypothetical protein
MNELALFAGAGGGILGGHLLGWRTVCAVEWLMGWPLGWTDLKPLEMDKCPYVQQPHGEF